jgi:general stress protein 26
MVYLSHCSKKEMDSINREQPENNKQDLGGAEAAEKIKELAEKAETCFFCTNIQSGKPFVTRPMSAQKVDEQGNLWFLSADDSHKNEELSNDASVQLLFQGSKHSDFMSLYGKATISKDKQKIKELWEPLVKVWFTEGVDDPRITVIKVQPTEGYYWDTKHGSIVAFAKMIAGAVSGTTLDDSVEGKLHV